MPTRCFGVFVLWVCGVFVCGVGVVLCCVVWGGCVRVCFMVVGWSGLADVGLLADLFGVGRVTVLRWRGDPWFPEAVCCVGGVWLWRVDDVVLWRGGRV